MDKASCLAIWGLIALNVCLSSGLNVYFCSENWAKIRQGHSLQLRLFTEAQDTRVPKTTFLSKGELLVGSILVGGRVVLAFDIPFDAESAAASKPNSSNILRMPLRASLELDSTDMCNPLLENILHLPCQKGAGTTLFV